MSHYKHHEGTYLAVEDEPQFDADDHSQTPLMTEALNLAGAMMEISQGYNIRRISPRQIVELSSRLHEAGVIGLAEYAALSFQPDLLAEYDPEEETYKLMQADPDRERDFIAEWERHLQAARQLRPDPFNLKLTSDILDLLQCFEPFEDEEN
ncbi:MAG: hypothetical protein DRP83_05725 [Planctomycetota bacterium]|nr:MAG: hypothetical protein DRP83_05725 [Planctomycetota bacterium]